MLAESLKANSQREWEMYTKHKFVMMMADGSLPIENFKFYLLQDSLYVSEMIRSVIAAAAKMPQDMAFSILSAVILGRDKGMETHSYLEKELGIAATKKMTFTTYAYTRHLLYAAETGWSQFLAAWIPCMWGYSEVGRYVVKSPNKYYKMWAEFYASEEYSNRVAVILKALDRYNGDLSRIEQFFKISLKYEQKFWQAALDMEETL